MAVETSHSTDIVPYNPVNQAGLEVVRGFFSTQGIICHMDRGNGHVTAINLLHYALSNGGGVERVSVPTAEPNLAITLRHRTDPHDTYSARILRATNEGRILTDHEYSFTPQPDGRISSSDVDEDLGRGLGPVDHTVPDQIYRSLAESGRYILAQR